MTPGLIVAPVTIEGAATPAHPHVGTPLAAPHAARLAFPTHPSIQPTPVAVDPRAVRAPAAGRVWGR